MCALFRYNYGMTRSASITFNAREKPVSQLIAYPDGFSRILTMQPYEWAWIPLAIDNGWEFSDIIRMAVELAWEFPTRNGYDYDVLDSTRYMLRVINQMIYEKNHGVINSF